MQQIPCNLRPQRRVPASQLKREDSGFECKCGTSLQAIFSAHIQASCLVCSVRIINAVYLKKKKHPTQTSPAPLVSFIKSSICLPYFLHLLFHLALVHSHLLTSGSVCLGNREVVRYLYRILMSSCSSPLLQVQPQRKKITPFNLHDAPCENTKPKCVAVESNFQCATKCVMHHGLKQSVIIVQQW